MFVSQIKYAFHKHPFRMWISLLATVVVLFWCTYEKVAYEKFQWFDPIIGGLTFMMSLFIFINQIRIEWEESLQKRISVFFEFEGRVVMKFENGVVPEGTDLRAWSQQIGAQMGYSRNLKFEPSIATTSPKIDWDKTTQEHFKLFTVTFELTELPFFENYQISPNVEPDEAKRKSAEQAWRKNRREYLDKYAIEWYASFDDRGKLTITRIPNDQ